MWKNNTAILQVHSTFFLSLSSPKQSDYHSVMLECHCLSDDFLTWGVDSAVWTASLDADL